MQYYQKLKTAIEQQNSLLCVGLDPVPERLPEEVLKEKNPTLSFLLQIIESTLSSVAAFKPNFAYFESLGPKGMETLAQVIEAIPQEIVVIGDAKRGDVGHSAQMYAKAVFETYQCDAVTVNPYQGFDAVAPFLDYQEKGTYILCLTSNPGANDFQIPENLYLRVAEKAMQWNTRQNCGLVVGATQAKSVEAIRHISGTMPFLIPGIGAQGGNLEKTVSSAENGTSFPFLINVSRDVLYVSSGADFGRKAGERAHEIKEQINAVRNDS
ncbi:MAG: orotidine-5'-phosphate decarboxylase [SAR324 cluster bacterium]|nr:orotidine-5'-phosphate decarboxylase [SAR324 cluster bacterium]